MNPYETDPSKIPDTDLYADVPLYGRYLPHASDFHPEPKHFNSTTPESLKYWESVLEKCDTTVRLYDNVDGGRDVFALGSIIIKSSHLKKTPEGKQPHRDYSLADANEVGAIAIARRILTDIQAPTIYFANKIQGRDVLIQSRIEGVALNVAWPYLPADQKASFKSQARNFLRQIHKVRSPSTSPSYMTPDDDPVRHRNITELEYSLLFGDRQSNDQDLGFMHNDTNESNIIVNHDKIIAVVDWEMAGYFRWKRAGTVHARCRAPKREDFANLDLPEARLADLVYWNDLYTAEP